MSNKQLRGNEQGLVSILVTMIMILVITLIVVGFTQVTNRNNRVALDNQLSTQAFYAAESGVNQAINAIEASTDPDNLDAQDTCVPSGGPAQYGNVPVVLNASPDVRVTCLLVDPVNENVVASASQGTSTTVPIESVDENGNPRNLTSMSITWKSPDAVSASAAATCASDFAAGFPIALSADCAYGVLRMDLFQNQAPTSVTTADAAAAATITLFLVPRTGGAVPDISTFAGDKAFIINAVSCNQSNCRAEITLSGSARGQKYFARLSSLYKDAPNVVIDGLNNGGGGPGGVDAYFTGIFKIDATGKAQDVLRRVQVRYNPYKAGGGPFGALQTSWDSSTNPGAGICKLLTVIDNNNITSDDGSCN